jgi:membrane-associated protease RseP (regulator of RpoE activity)
MIRSASLLAAVLVLAPFAAGQEPPAPQPPVPAESTEPAAEPAPAPPQSPADVIEQRLGLRFAVLGSTLRRAAITTATPYGFAIRTVAPGSLGAAAGLRRGTIVLAVDGVPLRETAQLADALRGKQAGEFVTLSCARRKRPIRLLDRHPWEQFELVLELDPPPPAPERER